MNFSAVAPKQHEPIPPTIAAHVQAAKQDGESVGDVVEVSLEIKINGVCQERADIIKCKERNMGRIKEELAILVLKKPFGHLVES